MRPEPVRRPRTISLPDLLRSARTRRAPDPTAYGTGPAPVQPAAYGGCLMRVLILGGILFLLFGGLSALGSGPFLEILLNLLLNM